MGVKLENLSSRPPTIYRTLWGVSSGYVFVDTAVQVHNLSEVQGVTDLDLVVKTVDTVAWHSLASLIVPGVTIHSIVEAPQNTMSHISTSVVPHIAITLCPPLVGIAAIPFIIHPIDHAAEWLADNTWRKVLPVGNYV